MHSEVLILSMQLITKRKRDFEEHMKPRGPKLTDHLTHWEWSRTRTQLNRNRRTTNSEEETSRHPLHCFRACLSLFFFGEGGCCCCFLSYRCFPCCCCCSLFFSVVCVMSSFSLFSLWVFGSFTNAVQERKIGETKKRRNTRPERTIRKRNKHQLCHTGL